MPAESRIIDILRHDPAGREIRVCPIVRETFVEQSSAFVIAG
jgi:hypothetical protein